MKTLFKSINLIRCVSGANLNLFRYAAMVAVLLMLGIGNAWAGGSTYKTDFKATADGTGKGYVYASTSSSPSSKAYAATSDDISESSDTGGSDKTTTYYAWAKAVRGNEFKNWSISGSNGGVSPTSSTNNPVTVNVTSNKENGTNTGTATANWTSYTKVDVTYNPSENGSYSVSYQYDSYNSSSKTITTGDAENLSRTITAAGGAQTIGSYYNDVITLTSTSGTFEGWYSDAGFNTPLSGSYTNPTYTFVAPQSGTASVYAKYADEDKYYGRLTASIADVPYSMPGGGMIFATADAGAAVAYSDAAQTVNNTTFGETSQKFYLKAEPTDKRYVFRGWYNNPQCTGTALSTSAEYTYTLTATSESSVSPTMGAVYAAFDFNLYYMQVEVEPAIPSQGMVLVSDTKLTSPAYTEFSSESSQFAYAYRLTHTTDVYVYAKPKYGYKLSGWYTDAACTIAATVASDGKYTASSTASTDPLNPDTITLYAKFVPATDGDKISLTYKIPDKTKGEYTASVLDITEVDDEYVWTFTEVYNSVDYTADKAISQHKTDVLRLEAACKAGYGVTSWTDAGTAKTTPSHLYETTGTATEKTYGVAFGDAKPFLVSTNSTQYATLREALTAVGSSGKITVVQNAYVEPGDYTIPSGVSLIVPYESTGKTYTSPSSTYEKNQAFSSASQYVLLTLGSGVNITIAGSLYVMADLCSANGGAAGCGAPATAYGRIAMSENSSITINSNANLYCWGFITGTEGLVTVKNGGKVHEPLQHQNNPGGTKAFAWNEKAFFMNQYYVQNVESPLKIEYGAVNQVYALMYIKGYQHANAALISKDNAGMFALTSSSSYLIRTYNPATDRTTYDIYGNAKLNYISMSVYVDIDTRNYVLPITSNLSVKCHTLNGTASTFNVPYAVSFLPGAELFVDEGVTVDISSKLIIYDRDEWIDKGFAEFNFYSGGTNWSRSSFTPTRTYTRTKADLVDAKVDLNGTMSVSGSLYTTTNGAAITSSNGTGIINLSAAAPGNSNDIQYASNNLGTSTNVAITPAKLLNADGSYLATAGAAKNDQFIYSKNLGIWMKNPKTVTWNANGGTTEATTMAYSEGAFIGELPAAYKEGHTFAGWWDAASGGTQITPVTKVTANETYYAHWTPKQYNITYMDQGKAAFSSTHIDTPNAHPTKHTYGTATTLNGANDKTGYDFGGWHTISNCKESSKVTSLSGDAFAKDITLYAKWTATNYHLTYEGLNGASNSNPANYTIETATITLANPGTRTGYTFAGWTCGGSPITQIALGSTGDKTITANWTANTNTAYTVNHYKQKLDGTYAVTPDEMDNLTGTTAAEVTPARKSYEGFEAPAGQTVTILADGSRVVTYNYTRKSYNLSWVTDGDALTGSYTSGSTKYGASITTPATPTKTGYTFAGWHNGSSVVTPATSMPAAATTYTATWNVVTYNLTYDGLNGATNSNPATYTVETATITLADPGTRTGYTFAGWTCGGSPITQVALGSTGDKTITANWTPNTNTAYTVKHFKEKLEGGYNAEPDETDNLTGTTAAEVTPAVKNYAGFTAPAAQTVTILADGSRVVEYQYTRNSYTLTWVTDGDALTGSYTHGETKFGATITAPNTPTKTGYTFKEWTPAKAETMPAAATEYTATWTPIPYTITWLNEDSSLIETTEVAYDATPTHADVSKAFDGCWDYNFSGWEPEIVAVTGEATYQATFTPQVHYFAITWKNLDGNYLTKNPDNITCTDHPAYPTYLRGVPTYQNGTTLYVFSGWKNKRTGVVYAKDALLPKPVEDETYIAQYDAISHLAVANEQTIDVSATVETTTVHVAGNLTITNNNELTTTDLILEGTPNTSGQITGAGTLTATRAYFHFSNGTEGFKAKTWYAVAVPWQVDVPAYDKDNGGVYLKKGNGTYVRQELGKTYDLIYYNGALRATGANKAWRYVEDDASDKHIMLPGRAYMIYLTTDADTIRFERKAGAVLLTDTLETKKYEVSQGVNGTYADWNGIANPALYHAYLNVGATEDIGQIYVAETKEYKQFNMRNSMLVVGQPIFVQPAEAVTIVANANSYNPAPRRANGNTQMIRYEVQFAASEREASDRIIIRMDEDKEENIYIVGQDLAKLGVSSMVPQMWIDRYDSRLCVQTAIPRNNKADYPLSLFVPQEGEYTIGIPANEDGPSNADMLYLTRDNRVIWNLSYAPYTLTLGSGTTSNYGLRLVHNTTTISTDVENSMMEAEAGVQKIILDDAVYILRGGEVYSIDGRLVR